MYKDINNNSLGHSLILHGLDSVAEPRTSQPSPPFCGTGLIQARSRICSPAPHEAEHVEYSLHSE